MPSKDAIMKLTVEVAWGRLMSMFERAAPGEMRTEYLVLGVKRLLADAVRLRLEGWSGVDVVTDANLPAFQAAIRSELSKWDAEFLGSCVARHAAFPSWRPSEMQRPILHGILVKLVDWAENWEVRQRVKENINEALRDGQGVSAQRKVGKKSELQVADLGGPGARLIRE